MKMKNAWKVEHAVIETAEGWRVVSGTGKNKKLLTLHLPEADTAYLIAAAPDLLEACKIMKDFINNSVIIVQDNEPPAYQSAINEKYTMLCKAITKAEGRVKP